MTDVIVLDPENVDFPIFKKQLEKFREHFFKIIIIPTSKVPFGEWRDVCTNQGLEQSVSEWVLFLEQDFFFTQHFLETVEKEMKNYDVIGFWEANRLHPAFLLIKRSWIEKTTRDFAPVYEEQLDHFGLFSHQLVELGIKIGELEKIGLKSKEDFYHMQGLTHNYNLCRDNNLSSVFKPEEFLTYHKYAKILNPNLPDIENQLGTFKEIKWLKKFLTLL